MQVDSAGNVSIDIGDRIRVTIPDGPSWVVEVADLGLVLIKMGRVIDVTKLRVAGNELNWRGALVPIEDGEFEGFLTTGNEVYVPGKEGIEFRFVMHGDPDENSLPLLADCFPEGIPSLDCDSADELSGEVGADEDCED